MSNAVTIARNTAFLAVSEVISKLLSFFIIVYMTRFYGDVNMGKYSFAVAFFSIFTIFTDLGITTLMCRDISRDKSKAERYFNNILALKSILSVTAFIISLIGIFLLGKTTDTIVVVAATSLYLMICEIIQPFRSLYTAYERLEFITVINFAERVVALSLACLLISIKSSLAMFLFAFVSSYTVCLILAIIITRRTFLKFRFEFDIKFWIQLIKAGAPFWFTSIFIMIYNRIDTLMLTYFKGYAVVGWYSSASRIVEAFLFIQAILVGALFPALSQMHVNAQERLKYLYAKSFHYLIMAGLILALELTMLADRIVPFMYGPEFVNSGPVLKILCWSIIFLFLNFLNGYLLNSIDKQMLFTLASGITVVFGAAVNLILIPPFGHIGAAYGNLTAQIVTFSITYYFVAKNNCGINLLKLFFKPVIAGIFAVASILLLYKFHLIIVAAGSGLTYLAVLLATKAIGKEEFDLARALASGGLMRLRGKKALSKEP